MHARHGQEVYTHNHNLRSRDKRFDEGDKVIVFDNDAAGKLCKRWQGPATVVHIKSPYHGLRGSASRVLTATGFVNGRWQFSTPMPPCHQI